MQKPKEVVLAGLLLLDCLASFLIVVKTTSIEMAALSMGLLLPHQSPIKKVTCHLAYSLIIGGISSIEVVSSLRPLVCVKMI